MSVRVEHIGDATLYLGDCREILPTLGMVDAVVTDPPYGVGLGVQTDPRSNGHGLGKNSYHNFCDSPEHFASVIVPSVKLALSQARRGAVFGGHKIVQFGQPSAIGGIYLPSGCGRNPWGFTCFSPIWFYGSAPDLHKGARPTVLRSAETAEHSEHPCPKPLGWMRWLVGFAARDGETVMDPFMGSGTTGVACLRLGRKFIGIEIDPTYFSIACRRIEQEARQGRLQLAEPKPAYSPEQDSLLSYNAAVQEIGRRVKAGEEPPPTTGYFGSGE